jgi:alkanesulfonate monooxygenase SsuD/methylene tetrahydromethanopterin reductase-like flavin-dependent oxidoreductase (luciferase family)
MRAKEATVEGEMKFSYVMLPDYPLRDSIEMIQAAEELGFHACYSVDETWHKDMWLLFAAAADKTTRIRFGPSLTPIGLREPTLVAQALATLDELTGGRTECVFSIGNLGLLAQYGIDWTAIRPLSRVKEAHHVLRTFLDDGAIEFEGDFYTYKGLFTFARPVQERVPVKIGAMRGPRSFQLAGEISDGVHHALSYSREAYEFLVENVKIGAERAGRDWRDLDIGAWVAFAVAPDSAEAKRAARIMVAFYISSMPREQIERHGIDPASLQPIVEALGRGEIEEALELTSPEVAEKLSIAGTPEECVARIRQDIAPTGVNHMILAITDPALVKTFTGKDVDVPDVKGQLQLVHDSVMPAFGYAPAGATSA